MFLYLQNADYLPDVPNVNTPKGLGVVMPRQILEDWAAIGFDPWSAGKQLRTTTMLTDLSAMERATATEEEAAVSTAKVLGDSVGVYWLTSVFVWSSGASCVCVRASTTADAVATAANAKKTQEQQQLEQLFSFCRHGKYAEIEEVRLAMCLWSYKCAAMFGVCHLHRSCWAQT